MQRRHFECVGADQRALRLALHAGSLLRPGCRRLHAGCRIRAELAHLCLRFARLRGRTDDDIVVEVVIICLIVIGASGVEGRLDVIETGRIVEAGLDAIAPPCDCRHFRHVVFIVVAMENARARHAGRMTPDEGAGRQPPVRDGPEGCEQAAALVFVVLEVVLFFFHFLRAAPAGRFARGRRGVFVNGPADDRRTESEQPQGRHCIDCDGQDRGRTCRIAAGEPGRDRKCDITHHAAEAGGQGPGRRRADAANDAGGQRCSACPRRCTARHAVDSARQQKPCGPGQPWNQRDDR